MYISKSKISYPISLSSDELFIKKMFSVYMTETEDNDFINSLIQSSTDQTEGNINQDIAFTNNVINLIDFSGSSLVVPSGNFHSITNIINNDSSTLVDYSNVQKTYTDFTIVFDSAIESNSLTINFKTGYENEIDVPKGLKQAIVLKAAGLYDHTDMYDTVWASLCGQYKIL